MTRRWSVKEVRYLEAHAGDGARCVAAALNRSVRSVESQALRYGISLRKAWLCPKCGRSVHAPLRSSTGWCSACTKAQRRERIAEEVRELEEEVMREREEDVARQALYSKRSRLKKKLKSNE